MDDKTVFADKETNLFKELDKGIDDMEQNRVTPHEETMKILTKRLEEYVIQNP